MEMALKGQKSGSTSLGPGNAGPETAQLGDVEPHISTHDAATLEATEEANRKLRILLSSFAKPQAAKTNLTSNAFQVAEDGGIATVQLGYAKSETLKQETASCKAIYSANQKLKSILSSLQEPEAADANLQPNISQIAKDDDENSESEEGSQISSITSVSAASSKTVAVDFLTAAKGGRWFETRRGSLKRIENEEKVNDGLNYQETISQSSSCFSETKGGSSETSVASREHEDVAKVSDFQLLFPNCNESEAFNVFQVPDVDEEGGDDEEEYDANEFPRNDNGGGRINLVEGEAHDEEIGLEEVVQGNLDEKAVNRASAAGEDSGHPIPKETVDWGNFTMSEVCVALGNGNIDEQRMRKLEKGFKTILAEALGKL